MREAAVEAASRISATAEFVPRTDADENTVRINLTQYGAKHVEMMPSGFRLVPAIKMPLLPSSRFVRTLDALRVAHDELAKVQAQIEAAPCPPGVNPEHWGQYLKHEIRSLTNVVPTTVSNVSWDVNPTCYMHGDVDPELSDLFRTPNPDPKFLDVQMKALPWIEELVSAVVDSVGLFDPTGPKGTADIRTTTGKGMPIVGSGVALTGDLIGWARKGVPAMETDLIRNRNAVAVNPAGDRLWMAKQILRVQGRATTGPLFYPVAAGMIGELALNNLGDMTGLMPKLRQAWMMPFALNVGLGAVVTAWLSLIKLPHLPLFWTFKHNPTTIGRRWALAAKLIATDFNKYDLSIRSRVARGVALALAGLVNWPRGWKTRYQESVDRLFGIAIAGSDPLGQGFVVYGADREREMGLESGLWLTSVVNTLITWSLRRVIQYGDIPRQTIRRLVRQWFSRPRGRPPWGWEALQGDDTLAEVYVDTAETGLISEVETPPAFLATPYLPPLPPRHRGGQATRKVFARDDGHRADWLVDGDYLPFDNAVNAQALCASLAGRLRVVARCPVVAFTNVGINLFAPILPVLRKDPPLRLRIRQLLARINAPTIETIVRAASSEHNAEAVATALEYAVRDSILQTGKLHPIVEEAIRSSVYGDETDPSYEAPLLADLLARTRLVVPLSSIYEGNAPDLAELVERHGTNMPTGAIPWSLMVDSDVNPLVSDIITASAPEGSARSIHLL